MHYIFISIVLFLLVVSSAVFAKEHNKQYSCSYVKSMVEKHGEALVRGVARLRGFTEQQIEAFFKRCNIGK